MEKVASLPDGLYKYVRMKDGRFAHGGIRTYHSELIEGADKYSAKSAGYFTVKGGVVSVPEIVEEIDEKNKSNRSVGLQRTPWPGDAAFIAKQFEGLTSLEEDEEE